MIKGSSITSEGNFSMPEQKIVSDSLARVAEKARVHKETARRSLTNISKSVENLAVTAVQMANIQK